MSLSAPEAEYFASPIPLEDLPTPSLLLDEERMEANAWRMAAHLGNMPLRPHLKTCRCWDVAQRMMNAVSAGFMENLPVVWRCDRYRACALRKI